MAALVSVEPCYAVAHNVRGERKISRRLHDANCVLQIELHSTALQSWLVRVVNNVESIGAIGKRVLDAPDGRLEPGQRQSSRAKGTEHSGTPQSDDHRLATDGVRHGPRHIGAVQPVGRNKVRVTQRAARHRRRHQQYLDPVRGR